MVKVINLNPNTSEQWLYMAENSTLGICDAPLKPIKEDITGFYCKLQE